MLIFQGSHNKVSETRWLKAIDIYCLTVLQAGSLKLSFGRAIKLMGKGPSLPLPNSQKLPAIFGIPQLIHGSLQSSIFAHLSFLCTCLSLCLNFPFLYRISHIEGGHTFTPSTLLDHWQRHYLQIRSQTQVHRGSVLTSFEGT